MNWILYFASVLLISQMSGALDNTGASAEIIATTKKASDASFAKWAAITQPSGGPAVPHGTYAAGCLAGGIPLNADGPGYAIMRPARRRNYSHPTMETYLNGLGERLRSAKLPVLLVGDVSPARGGPMRNGHNSHQTGLDADLWLRMSRKRPTRAQRESWSAPSFVIARKKLKKNWSSTQVRMIEAATDFPEVNRVFVSPAIKRYFCEKQPSAPWLYKLRAWWGHEEHIHVRLNCPADSTACVAQTPLNPSDNGCGTELDWWFSKEADEEWRKLVTQPKPREFPELPPACEELVNG